MQKLKRSSLYPTIRGIKFTLWIALPFVLGFLVFGVAKVPWVILKRLYTLFGIWVVSYFFLFSEWIGFHQRKTLDLHMEPAFIDLTSRIQSDLNKHCARTVKITNVINEQLKIKFERAWTQHHQLGSSKLSILIAYHGTKASNIDPIVKKGLLLPGITSGLKLFYSLFNLQKVFELQMVLLMAMEFTCQVMLEFLWDMSEMKQNC